MASRPSRRLSILRRVERLESTAVICRECDAMSRDPVRVVPDDEFEALVMTGKWRDTCSSCGLERKRPVKIIPKSMDEGV
jgi:hypothetical protein